MAKSGGEFRHLIIFSNNKFVRPALRIPYVAKLRACMQGNVTMCKCKPERCMHRFIPKAFKIQIDLTSACLYACRCMLDVTCTHVLACTISSLKHAYVHATELGKPRCKSLQISATFLQICSTFCACTRHAHVLSSNPDSGYSF